MATYIGIHPGYFTGYIKVEIEDDKLTVLDKGIAANETVAEWLREQLRRKDVEVGIEIPALHPLADKPSNEAILWVGEFRRIAKDMGVPVSVHSKGETSSSLGAFITVLQCIEARSGIEFKEAANA